MSKIPVNLDKNSYRSFTQALDENEVEYSRRIQLSEIPMAAGLSVEIFSALKDVSPWGVLAITIVAWLNAKASRKVIITTKNNEIFHAEGYPAEKVESMLEKAKNIGVIDTKPDNET